VIRIRQMPTRSPLTLDLNPTNIRWWFCDSTSRRPGHIHGPIRLLRPRLCMAWSGMTDEQAVLQHVAATRSIVPFLSSTFVTARSSTRFGWDTCCVREKCHCSVGTCVALVDDFDKGAGLVLRVYRMDRMMAIESPETRRSDRTGSHFIPAVTGVRGRVRKVALTPAFPPARDPFWPLCRRASRPLIASARVGSGSRCSGDRYPHGEREHGPDLT